AKRRHHQHTLRSARLDPEQQAVERELSRTEKQQCDCSDEEQELELPTPFAREPLVHLQDLEANRAQHDEDESGRRCLREQANQRRQAAQRLGGLATPVGLRSEEHTSELQSRFDPVCRLLLEKKKRT